MNTPIYTSVLLCLLCFMLTAADLQAKEDNSATDKAQAKEKIQEKAGLDAEAGVISDSSTVSTKYFSIDMPKDWKVIMPPVEGQRMVNAVFASDTQATVSIVVGANSGADLKTIAEMFAAQFKSDKPAQKRGQFYTFTYSQQDKHAESWVGSDGDIYIVTTFIQNPREGKFFLKKNLSSSQKELFPIF